MDELIIDNELSNVLTNFIMLWGGNNSGQDLYQISLHIVILSLSQSPLKKVYKIDNYFANFEGVLYKYSLLGDHQIQNLEDNH
jgi:hypothetical protein